MMQNVQPMKHPYACDQCDATFWYPSHLKLHLKKHQKITIFECQNCQRTFVKKKYYEKHIKSPCPRVYFVPDRFTRVWTADLKQQSTHRKQRRKEASLEGDGLHQSLTKTTETVDPNSETAHDASNTEILQYIPSIVVKTEVQEDLLKDAVSLDRDIERDFQVVQPNVKEETLEESLPSSGTTVISSQSNVMEDMRQDEAIKVNMQYWWEDNQSSRESFTAWSDKDSIRVPSPKKPRYDSYNKEGNVDQLGELLKMWHLFDDLYEFFRAKGLTIEGLRYMKERHIDEAFGGQKLNSKIIFEHKLSEWQNEQGIYYIRSRAEEKAVESFQSSRQSMFPFLQASMRNALVSESNACPDFQDLSVHSILKQSQQGQDLLNAYAEDHALLPTQRKLLVNEVVQYFIVKDMKISVQLCRILANQIVAEFPTECIDTYFVQKDRRAPPKGKLWDRYQSKKRSMKRWKMMEVADTPHSDAETAVPETNLDWQTTAEELKTSLPWNEVWSKWLLTIPYRTLYLSKAQLPLQQILSDWPLFKCPRSPELVDIDFKYLHSNHTFHTSKWSFFYVRAPHIFKERIKKSCTYWHILRQFLQTQHTLSKDNQHIYLLMLLHAVLPPTTVVVNRKQIKYSVMDSYHSFTRAVKDAAELDYVIAEKKAQCQQSLTSLHPYMIVLGELNAYREFYVVLDDIKFAFPSYLEALQHCFKLFRILYLKFPNESSAVWLFVQKYLFGMNEDSIKNPVVDTLINDFNVCSGLDRTEALITQIEKFA